MNWNLTQAKEKTELVVPASDLPPMHIVHGIRTFRSVNSFTALMAEEFRMLGFTTHEEYYGNLSIFGARWRNQSIAESLYETIPDGSIYVGHSNGAALAWMLDQMGKKFAGVILVQPALDRGKLIHNSKFVHVYHNAKDCALSWTRVLLWHPWGPQGRDGPNKILSHYKVFDTLNTTGMPPAAGHNWYKQDYLRSMWAGFMADRIFSEEV